MFTRNVEWCARPFPGDQGLEYITYYRHPRFDVRSQGTLYLDSLSLQSRGVEDYRGYFGTLSCSRFEAVCHVRYQASGMQHGALYMHPPWYSWMKHHLH